MKRKILWLMFAFLMATSSVFAQESSSSSTDKNFWWGPKVGVDLATPTTNEATIRSEVKSNFQVGLFFQFGKKFYIQPEIYYATRKEQIVSGTVTTENKVNSLRVPLLLGMRIFNLGVVSGHIQAGPAASYVLDQDLGSTSFDKKNLNFSLTGGAGVDVIGLITLDVRYAVPLNSETRNSIKQLRLDDGVNVTLGLKF
ncbi:MAG: porin family protein [Pedobacter sp.]|nr:porin family protein [Pedobacter sp.]MDQ8053618.1 porin family protein [Pedobacter sp.]